VRNFRDWGTGAKELGDNTSPKYLATLSGPFSDPNLRYHPPLPVLGPAVHSSTPNPTSTREYYIDTNLVFKQNSTNLAFLFNAFRPFGQIVMVPRIQSELRSVDPATFPLLLAAANNPLDGTSLTRPQCPQTPPRSSLQLGDVITMAKLVPTIEQTQGEWRGDTEAIWQMLAYREQQSRLSLLAEPCLVISDFTMALRQSHIQTAGPYPCKQLVFLPALM